MGTRADFYIGRGAQAEWIGSKAFDGYFVGVPFSVRRAKTEAEFRLEVLEHIADTSHTLPHEGWPWPWPNSNTTDYTYAFDDGSVFATCGGRPWRKAGGQEPEWGEKNGGVEFPDMSNRKQADHLAKSGFIVVRVGQ